METIRFTLAVILTAVSFDALATGPECEYDSTASVQVTDTLTLPAEDTIPERLGEQHA